MWVSLIMALLSYFTAKKSGASNTTAALAAAAVGAGTYYVAAQTDWGKSSLGSINDSIAGVAGFGYIDPQTGVATTEEARPVLDSAGNQVKDSAGNLVFDTATKAVVKDASGNPVRSADGSFLNGLVTSTAGVLKSWGPAGTAAVIATGSLAASSGGISGFLDKYGVWIAGGVALFILAR